MTLAAIAALLSCDNAEDPSVSLSADQAFDANGEATITLTLSEASVSDVLVNLEVAAEVSSGKALPEANLTFEKDMVVRAGQLTASQTVTVKPDGLQAGEYKAVIRIGGASHAVPATGHTMVGINLKLENSYGPGGGGNNESGGNNENGGNKNWKVSYEGFQEVEWEEGTNWNEVFKVSGQGSASIYFTIVDEGTYDSFKDNLDGLYAQAEEWLEGDLEYYADYGWTIDDFVVTEDPHYEYYDAMAAGTYEAFAFGMTSEGKSTKEFAWVSFEIPEGHTGGSGGGEMELQTNWSVSIVGSIYVDDEGDDVIDIEVNAPGIQYYIAEENTQADLDEYYEGTIEGLAASYQDYCQEYIGEYSMEDILYYSGYPQDFMYVYNPGMQTTIYLLEFDEDGFATGRYGATTLTMPRNVAAHGLNSRNKLKIRIRK